MKVTALLLMILGTLLIAGLGLLLLLMSVMAFGAPGPVGRLGSLPQLFLLLLAFIFLLVFAGRAYRAGNYTRSAGFGSVFGIALLGSAIFWGKTTSDSLQTFQAIETQAVEEARLHPIQKFARPGVGSGDTITVLPGRMVWYRLFGEGGLSYAGTVGNLNATRDTILVSDQFRGAIKREEFSQFVDAKGRRLTDVFAIR